MIEAIYLGITQGVTEFLPVSSSGHLFLIQRMLQGWGAYREENFLAFFVFLHAATLLAIIIYLFKNIHLLFKKIFFLNVLQITIITGIIGFAIKLTLSRFFTNSYLLSFCFLMNAGILFSIKKTSGDRTWKNLLFKDSLIIGILQGISFLPGISRSGITITGLLKRGFSREEAFMISFLCAVPVISGAFLLEFKELANSSFSFPEIAIGFVMSFVFGLIALAFLKKILILEKFRNFAYYCLAASLMSLLI